MCLCTVCYVCVCVLRYVLPNVLCNMPRYVLPNVVCNVLRYVFPRRLKSDQKQKVPTHVLPRLHVTATICTHLYRKNVFMFLDPITCASSFICYANSLKRKSVNGQTDRHANKNNSPIRRANNRFI